MRLMRGLVILVLIAIAGWLIVRTVSVQDSSDKVQITIDKQKLKRAGTEIVDETKEAAHKASEALHRTGDNVKRETQEATDNPPPAQAPQ